MSCGEISLLLCVLILSAVIGVSPAVGRASPMGAETFPFRRYHGQLVSDVEQKDPGYIRWLEGQPDVAKKYPTLSLRLTQKPSAAASVGIGSPVSPAHGEEKLSASLEQEQPAPPSVEMGCISPASVDVGSPVSSSPGDGDHGEICWRGKHKGRPVSDIHKEDPDHFARTLKYRPQDAIKDPHYHAFLERHRSPPISPNQRNLSSWTMTDWRSSPETQPPATPPREGAQRANATRNVEDTPLPPPHSPAQRKRTNAPAATPSPRSPPPRSPSTSRPGSPASPGRGGRTNAPSSRRSPRARSPSSPNAPRAASATSPPSQLSPLRLEATKRRSPRKGQAGLNPTAEPVPGAAKWLPEWSKGLMLFAGSSSE